MDSRLVVIHLAPDAVPRKVSTPASLPSLAGSCQGRPCKDENGRIASAWWSSPSRRQAAPHHGLPAAEPVVPAQSGSPKSQQSKRGRYPTNCGKCMDRLTQRPSMIRQLPPQKGSVGAGPGRATTGISMLYLRVKSGASMTLF